MIKKILTFISRKKNLFLMFFLIILIILFFVGIKNLKYKDSSNKFITSALVNPKYLSQIQTIEFENKFNLVKINENWFVKINENKYPADTNKIEEMLNNFTKVIKMYKKSYSKKEKSQYFQKIISSNYNNCLVFYTSLENFSNKENISSICFGETDFTNTKIDILNLKNNEIFQAENIYTEYINPDVTFFIRKDFFPQNLSQNYSKIQQIIIKDFVKNHTIIYDKLNKNSEDKFYKKLNQILLLRSDDVQLNLSEKINNSKPITQVILSLGNDTTSNFSVYFIDNKFYVKTQDNLIFGISEWTFNRIVE